MATDRCRYEDRCVQMGAEDRVESVYCVVDDATGFRRTRTETRTTGDELGATQVCKL